MPTRLALGIWLGSVPGPDRGQNLLGSGELGGEVVELLPERLDGHPIRPPRRVLLGVVGYLPG